MGESLAGPEPMPLHPYCTEDGDTWWIVADSPWEALKVVHDHDGDPGWATTILTIRRVQLRGIEFDGGPGVTEAPYMDESTVEGFRIDVTERLVDR